MTVPPNESGEKVWIPFYLHGLKVSHFDLTISAGIGGGEWRTVHVRKPELSVGFENTIYLFEDKVKRIPVLAYLSVRSTRGHGQMRQRTRPGADPIPVQLHLDNEAVGEFRIYDRFPGGGAFYPFGDAGADVPEIDPEAVALERGNPLSFQIPGDAEFFSHLAFVPLAAGTSTLTITAPETVTAPSSRQIEVIEWLPDSLPSVASVLRADSCLRSVVRIKQGDASAAVGSSSPILILDYPTEVDGLYQIQINRNELRPESWEPIGSSFSGDGATHSCTLPAIHDQAAFFRIQRIR